MEYVNVLPFSAGRVMPCGAVAVEIPDWYEGDLEGYAVGYAARKLQFDGVMFDELVIIE